MDRQVDVVVVGAGPVGLLTAIELTVGGARVLVLERLAAASPNIKAGGLGPLGLEALERRGMAAAIAAAEARSFAAMVQAGADPRAKGSKYSGHFAGLSAERRMNMRRVAGEQHPAFAVGVDKPRIVRPSAAAFERLHTDVGTADAA
jgi:2-polyprenyl-6-methoxyphenol hydroxylase-like FAD-dependent oxidoreductase